MNMELLKLLKKNSYEVKELSSQGYDSLLKMFNCRHIQDLFSSEIKEQLQEHGLEIQDYEEEVYYDVENPERLAVHYIAYILDNKNMVKYIVADYFK